MGWDIGSDCEFGVKVIVLHTELARTRKLTQTGQHIIRDEMVTKLLIVFPIGSKRYLGFLGVDWTPEIAFTPNAK